MNEYLKDALSDAVEVLENILDDNAVQGVYKVHFDEHYIKDLKNIIEGEQ